MSGSMSTGVSGICLEGSFALSCTAMVAKVDEIWPNTAAITGRSSSDVHFAMAHDMAVTKDTSSHEFINTSIQPTDGMISVLAEDNYLMTFETLFHLF